jgi:hypothetical protein
MLASLPLHSIVFAFTTSSYVLGTTGEQALTPQPPRRLNKAIPAELETIVLKAMAKSAEERYATVQELADDLDRYLEDKPIRAKRPTLVQRATKWSRPHRGYSPGVFSAPVKSPGLRPGVGDVCIDQGVPREVGLRGLHRTPSKVRECRNVHPVSSANKTIDIDNVNHVLLQPHWQKESDLVDF